MTYLAVPFTLTVILLPSTVVVGAPTVTGLFVAGVNRSAIVLLKRSISASGKGFSSDVSDQSGRYLPLRLTLRDGLTAASVQEVELRGATSITFPANKFFTEKNGTLDSETVVMRLDKITTSAVGVPTVTASFAAGTNRSEVFLPSRISPSLGKVNVTSG